MIRQGRDELICDLAETYRIYSLQGLPARMLATLAVGLRDDSRIKMLMRGEKYPLSTLLSAATLDRLSLLLWAQTQDAQDGKNQPKSILSILLGNTEDADLETFEDVDAFEDAWAGLTGVSHGR